MTPTVIFGEPHPRTLHTPSCSQGRCGATNHAASGGLAFRCVHVGKATHGPNHRDVNGVTWPGEFITVDRALEEMDH